MTNNDTTMTQHRQGLRSPHFWVALTVLLIAAVGWNATMRAMGVVLAKAKVPLESPLGTFPDRFGDRFRIAKEYNTDIFHEGKAHLPHDVVETLGTEEYIDWIFIDERSSTTSPTAVRLHVAYYTGILDAAPHVPDNCMVAGGLTPAGDSVVVWPVENVSEEWGEWQAVEVKRAAFQHKDATGPEGRIVSYYVFSVNGKPMSDRKDVRFALANPFAKYCYYAKIELSSWGGGLSEEDREAVCREFFAEAMPHLQKIMPSPQHIRELEHQRGFNASDKES